jgi:hypothetical protein
MAVDTPAPDERESRILALWEGAVGLPRPRRGDALLRDCGAPRPLGERNRRLLALRGALFGRSWPLTSDCPGCAAACELSVDCAALTEALDMMAPPTDGARFDWNGQPIAVRAPTADDLSAIADGEDIAGAAAALLARCLPADFDLSQLAAEDLETLEGLIESLDPAAAISFALECPACGHGWSAPVDVANAVWTELQRAAELTLTEVDALARAYGWTENQVIGLSPARRAAYLQLAAA